MPTTTRVRVTISAGAAWPPRVERIELDGTDTTERNGVTPPADGEEHHVHVVTGPAWTCRGAAARSAPRR